MFEVTNNPIDSRMCEIPLKNKHAGALVTFNGIVKTGHQHLEVSHLQYETHEPLAKQTFIKIERAIKQQFTILDVYCIHRTGKVNVGETAIWIGVTAVHRHDAFRACHEVINQIKDNVPIWKKEFYTNGESQWL